MIARIFAVIVCMLSAVWLSRAPDWEPLLAVLTAFGGYIGLEFTQRTASAKALAAAKKRERRLSRSDRTLFEKYEAHLGGSAYTFLREHDMGASFLWKSASPFHEYADCWKGPQFEFVDTELEASRRILHVKLMQFIDAMVSHTFSKGDILTMELEDEDTDPKKYEIRDMMNRLGHEAADAYEDFVRLGRARLKEDEA